MHNNDDSNYEFKNAVIEAFEKNAAATLVIAADARKFTFGQHEHRPVLGADRWHKFLEANSKRIHIVTSAPQADLNAEQRVHVEQELKRFAQIGISAEI